LPENPSSVLHVDPNNHAVALAKQEDWRSNKEAIRLLDLIKDDDGSLKALAQSARAAAPHLSVPALPPGLKEFDLDQGIERLRSDCMLPALCSPGVDVIGHAHERPPAT
jgi:hypothetical protein